MKKLSIIIPCYNVEEYIRECFDSLLPQITEDVQVIVVDDASTDRTLKIIQEYKNDYDFTFVPLPKNLGAAGARNAALELAQGEYLAFVDSDDVVPDYYIEKIINALKDKKDYYKLAWSEFGYFGYREHKIKNPTNHSMMVDTIIKKSHISNSFDESLKYLEDVDFFKKNLGGKKLNYGLIKDIMYHYRRLRKGSLTYKYKNWKE